jgi:hypothetical protein
MVLTIQTAASKTGFAALVAILAAAGWLALRWV